MVTTTATTEEQQAAAAVAYTQTEALLQQPASFLAPIASVVSLKNVVEEPPSLDEHDDAAVTNFTSLLTPNRGHHALFRALEELEGLEKQEAELQLQNSCLTPQLTSVVTGDDYTSARHAVDTLEALCISVPRRVCQHPFKRNDIVWVCRTCQADETCVLCHNCFKQSHHDGHDVAFYHAQAGGCCDCGDPDAWSPDGFCPHHGPTDSPSLGPLSPRVISNVQGVVPAVLDWMVNVVAQAAQQGHERARPPVGTVSTTTASSQSGNRAMVPVENTTDTNTNTNRTTTDTSDTTPSIFNPHAAGSIKLQRQSSANSSANSEDMDDTIVVKSKTLSQAEQLGMLGRQGGGLYLVLRSDDIHTTAQWVDALRDLLGTSSLYTDSILQKLVRALRQYGQLVVWGTLELLAESLSPTQISLWLDGDRIASGMVGSAMLARALLLTSSHGLYCSIVTLDELLLEQRAVAILQWLTCLARSCDPLCQKVAESIGPDRHLVPLLRADFKLSSRITKYWHSLLLTLLAVPTFKSHLAAAYCDTYQLVTSEYARGMGVLERSGYALSVQFLNRVTYVVDLVQGRDLLGKLGKSLLQTLQVACGVDTNQHRNNVTTTTTALHPHSQHPHERLNPNHFCLTHRRYSPCISDLKCVLNVKGMPRLFASKSGTFLKDWIDALALGQWMDAQAWRDWTQGHVEQEVRGWVGAFNASISLGSLFERLLSWDDDDPSPIEDPDSPLSKNLMTCVELTVHVLTTGIAEWQNTERLEYSPTPYTASLEPYKRRPASLPFSTVAARHGSVLAFSALPVSQMTHFSFHLPLHRFVAACLREVCLRANGMDELMAELSARPPVERNALFLGLLEFPLLVLSRAAQVRAGLWKRNGPGLNDQVLNYAEPPFCRAMRDADLLLVQFAMLGRTLHQSSQGRPTSDVGVTFQVHLLLHRLGIFDFCGLAKGPNSDINRYLEQVKEGLYLPEQNSDDMADDFLLPWTYSPARDAASSLLLLEEFLHMMIILTRELPPLPPTDKTDHTEQAKFRLRREVVHRLASGPKTHSELAEVHHVLSHWDNVFLSEEGKLVNPDDATGAALGTVLADVAERKISRGKMEPDKWELKREAWESYDPSFFHISLRSHQTAAESRPTPTGSSPTFGVESKALAPLWTAAHPNFARLRRDITCDATVLSILYRTLHMHCRDVTKQMPSLDLRGAFAYESDERSETAVARAVHLLTLGAYAWQDSLETDTSWRIRGGGSIGSIFYDRGEETSAPTAKDWVSAALLVDPRDLLACEWYEGEECALQILRRLAIDGGYPGGFTAQDRAVRAGAAWLCEFAVKHSVDARKLMGASEAAAPQHQDDKEESDIDKRKRIAKAKAMERMKAQAAKFASMMEAELGDEKEENDASDKEDLSRGPATPQRPVRQGSFGSARSSASSIASTSDSDKASAPFLGFSPETGQPMFDETMIPSRLLRARPQCIICSDDGNAERPARETEEVDHRKSRRRRTDGGNALAFVGYTQASTVLKGGGGPPTAGHVYSTITPVSRYVGTHVALCGHAVHSECWESYLATVSHREDRVIGKRDEFRCPLCQRLSNCLVPFIDVGVDWIDSATCLAVSKQPSANVKSDDGDDSMSCDPIDKPSGPLTLQEFLSCTPWWVPRHNDSVVWDGQCAFVSRASSKASTDNGTDKTSSTSPSSVKVQRRRSVRPLRKKDLYAAWNAMMRTPRSVRRKLRVSRGDGSGDEVMSPAIAPDPTTHHFSSSMDSSGETVVWRRFMDQISDISYRADGKRLGDENLHNDFGEFRHYIVEKYAYNLANRFAGKEPADWPSCVFPTALSDMQRQELSREKLLSKLMMSVQAFTYSCSCEAYEVRRLLKKVTVSSNKVAGITSNDSNVDTIYSKFGISGVVCDGKLIIMPHPSAHEDEGGQPFNGRLGKLRYLGLAIMAAAGAVAADLVQLVLPFPLATTKDDDPSTPAFEKPYRAPITYPILYGHVLTHVVAAICASSGRARARSDSLELVWPVPFSSRGSFVHSEGCCRKVVDSVVEDCEGFVKLGLLARILQVLLGKIDMSSLNNIPGLNIEPFVLKTLRKMQSTGVSSSSPLESKWIMSCISLLEMSLNQESGVDEAAVPEHAHVESAIMDRVQDGCTLAVDAACLFLADIGTVLQVLLPGVMARYGSQDLHMHDGGNQGKSSLQTLEKLRLYFRLEPVSEMLESSVVREVVRNWYEGARHHAKGATLPGETTSGSGAAVSSRLFKMQGFRVFDWPMESCKECSRTASALGKAKSTAASSESGEPQNETAVPMEIDTIQPSSAQTSTSELQHQVSPLLVTFIAKKSVPLIGGYAAELAAKGSGRPRVTMIPTSYTDLYAELGQLLPDSEQTAVCLICGEVLNAGGKGECTRHSFKCGAGTGMFFLLQECAGLIMHNGKAAYIHSPYVDSHGETPQYRGRPLNLDLDRYDHLHEVWSGHSVRQQVLAERGSSRQIIVPDFY